jgi:hypothetical protein
MIIVVTDRNAQNARLGFWKLVQRIFIDVDWTVFLMNGALTSGGTMNEEALS